MKRPLYVRLGGAIVEWLTEVWNIIAVCVGAVCLVIGIGWGSVAWDDHVNTRFTHQCQAKGGYAHLGSEDNVCVKHKSDIIHI